jgi:hypothetical protein
MFGWLHDLPNSHFTLSKTKVPPCLAITCADYWTPDIWYTDHKSALLIKLVRNWHLQETSRSHYCLQQCFLNYFPRRATRKIVCIPSNHCLWKRKYKHTHKETVVSPRKLLQYFQLSDKNSRDISKYVYNFLYLCIYFTISLGTRNDVLWNPKIPRNPVWETLTYIIHYFPPHRKHNAYDL